MIAYIGKLKDGVSVRELTDWHGNPLGTVRLGTGWRINSFLSDRMFHAHAIIDGIRYNGRTLGEGMSIRLRRSAKQF